MEINRLDDVLGATALQNLQEGRMVIIVPLADDQGLPVIGARYPINTTEAAEARYVVSWPQTNLSFPGPLSHPSLAYSLRKGGFDQSQTHPYSQDVYLTYPGMQEGLTIPSGYDCLLHGGADGVYTISSGVFTHNAGLVTGAKLEALNTGDDTTSAGMLNLTTTDAQTVAYVLNYNAPKRRLTIKTRAL